MIRSVIFIAFLFISLSSIGQEGTFSPYSFFGVGNNTFRGTAENRSMAGLSIFSDSIHVNLQNPAAYADLRLTTFTIGATANSLRLEDNTTTDNVNFSTVDYISIGIPFKKFGVGFGLKPLSAVGYEIQTIEDNIGKSLNGRGGLNTVYLSTGFKLFKNLSLGATANYNFGQIENRNIIIQEGIERSSREVNLSNLNGLTLNFGLQYTAKISKKNYLRASLSYSPETSLNVDNDRQLATILFGSDGNEVVIDDIQSLTTSSLVDFGSRINGGLGIGQERKWFVGLEYTNSTASNFEAINFNNNTDLQYIDSHEYKIGGYFIPRFNSPRGYFNRVVYRAGLRYTQTGIDFRNESLDEFGISFGLGLPAGRFFSNINLGAEYWMRGSTNNNLVQENYFSLFISLSFNDLWFQKPKFN
jgi:hypothetical protein